MTTTRPKTRERLIATAESLFYDEGVHVGVDRLCEVAGVSKRSLYQHFGNKDGLVVAMLDARAVALADNFLAAKSASPREKILDIFASLERDAATSAFRGCPFVNVAIELKDLCSPATRTAADHKRQQTDRFEALARAGGAAHPAVLAQQLMIVFDGACAHRVVHGEVPTAVIPAVEALLDSHGVTAG